MFQLDVEKVENVHSMSFGNISISDFLKFVQQDYSENYSQNLDLSTIIYCHSITVKQLTDFLKKCLQNFDSYTNVNFSYFEFLKKEDNDRYQVIQYIIVTDTNKRIINSISDSMFILSTPSFMEMENNYNIFQNILLKYKHLFDLYNINMNTISMIEPSNNYLELFDLLEYNILKNGKTLMRNDYNKLHIYTITLNNLDQFFIYLYIDTDAKSGNVLDLIPYEDNENEDYRV